MPEPLPGLPTFLNSRMGCISHIEQEGTMFHYIVLDERGYERQRFSSTDPNDIVYRVFRKIISEIANERVNVSSYTGHKKILSSYEMRLSLISVFDGAWVDRMENDILEVL